VVVPPTIALDLRDVTVRYGAPGARCTRALDGAALTVAAGDCVGVVGGPGAGTTTLLLCAAGLLGPDTGCVRWFGSHRWATARAAYAPQAAEGHHFLSVRAWLEFVDAQRGDDADLPDVGVERTLARTQLTEFAAIRVGHLTPGVSARLAVAGALLGRPRLLLVDRAFDPLSVVERTRFAQVLDSVRASGITLVVASHDASALAALAPRRIHYMAAGRVAPARANDAALELEVPLPVEARSRLALRVPSVLRRGRALRVPLGACTAEQVLSECRALGIEVRSSRVVAHDVPTRRRVAEPSPGAFAPALPAARPEATMR
jgi:ABC-type multidrug transport system ATPase subunit